MKTKKKFLSQIAALFMFGILAIATPNFAKADYPAVLNAVATSGTDGPGHGFNVDGISSGNGHQICLKSSSIVSTETKTSCISLTGATSSGTDGPGHGFNVDGISSGNGHQICLNSSSIVGTGTKTSCISLTGAATSGTDGPGHGFNVDGISSGNGHQICLNSTSTVSSATKTSCISIAGASYSCPSGGTLSGTTCETGTPPPPTPTATPGDNWLWGGSDDGNSTGQGKIGAGLGWISMDSRNCDTDGDEKNDACDMNNDGSVDATDKAVVVNHYYVSIPLIATGDLSGSAWSSNLGWISFYAADLGSCPIPDAIHGCSAYREGNSIKGWARIMSLKSAGKGWIHLWDTFDEKNGNPLKYGVDAKKMKGSALRTPADATYAWSDDHGAIDFSWAMATPVNLALPSVVFKADPSVIDINKYTDWKTSGAPVKLTWSNVKDADSCTLNFEDGTTANADIAVGEKTVTQKDSSVNYAITCTGLGGSTTKNASVYTGCQAKICSSNICGLGGEFHFATDPSTCSEKNKCSLDSDCQPRTGSGWQEVAP